jgi:hypothetical protein
MESHVCKFIFLSVHGSRKQKYIRNWRMPSSGIWNCVDLVWTDVSEEHISIFRVEPAHAGSSLADFSTLKIEAIHSSETSVHIRSTQRHIPEDDILHSNLCETLRSYVSKINFIDFCPTPVSTGLFRFHSTECNGRSTPTHLYNISYRMPDSSYCVIL